MFGAVELGDCQEVLRHLRAPRQPLVMVLDCSACVFDLCATQVMLSPSKHAYRAMPGAVVASEGQAELICLDFEEARRAGLVRAAVSDPAEVSSWVESEAVVVAQWQARRRLAH